MTDLPTKLHAELARLFPLHAIRTVPLSRAGTTTDTAFALPLQLDADLLDTWQKARQTTMRWGFYPVITFEALTPERLADGRVHCHTIGDMNVKAAVEQVAHLSFPGSVNTEFAATRRHFGTAPTGAQLRLAIGDTPSVVAVDRWVHEWELKTGNSPQIDTSYLSWQTPTDSSHPSLLLLPTTESWCVPTYIPFYGVDTNEDLAVVVSLLRKWSDTYRANIVAHLGTMLEFHVDRPPSTLDDAWHLAWEQQAIAPDTTWRPGVSVRHHARALLNRKTWFLHNRP